MVQQVLGRKYSLVIGEIPELVTSTFEPYSVDLSNKENIITGGFLKNNSSQQGYRDYVTVPSEVNSTEITELHIEVTVEMAVATRSTSSGATVKLKVFNLSKDNRAKIKTENSVILRAGYEQDDELPLIFAAQVINVTSKKEGVNIVTYITCGDSFTPRKNLRVSKTYPKNTTKKTVIQDLLEQAADYGVPTGEFFIPAREFESSLSDSLEASLVSTVNYNPANGYAFTRVNAPFPSGYAVHGLLFEELARVCDNIDFRSYLLQGSLYVEPIEYRIRQSTVEITQDNIIGSIKEDDEGSSNLTGDSLKQSGITLKVPLNGRITTTSLIELSDLDSEDLSGSYATTSLKHILNLEQGDWATQISCKKVS